MDKLNELLEWLNEFDNKPIKPTYANMREKVWQLQSATTPPALSAEEMADILNAYRNQPVQLTPTTEVYNRIPKVTIVGSFTQPRPPKEEADRVYMICGGIIESICVINYTIESLKLRGIDTTYEEEVLTILRGM